MFIVLCFRVDDSERIELPNDSARWGWLGSPSNVDVALCGALTMGSHQHVVRFPREVNPHPKEYLMETRRHRIAPAMCASSTTVVTINKTHDCWSEHEKTERNAQTCMAFNTRCASYRYCYWLPLLPLLPVLVPLVYTTENTGTMAWIPWRSLEGNVVGNGCLKSAQHQLPELVYV